MLRLNPFRLKTPASLEEACDLLHEANGSARVVAGGTDLVPNLKHGIYGKVETLVSLQSIDALNGVAQDGAALSMGAGEKLAGLADHALIRKLYPALASAAANVASPQIRNMATLGGNLCLDTRCTFINQSDFWRGALGGCLKANGDVCHVVPGGKNCVAALSGDMAIALIALDASVELVGKNGVRTLPIAKLYKADGVDHLSLQPEEILTRVHVSVSKNRRLSFRKWSVRQSIDFPLVNIAIRIDQAKSGEIEGMKVVVGVLGARPKMLSKLVRIVQGKKLTKELAVEIGEAVHKQCKPVPNVPYDHLYRREMLRVQAKRAVMCLIEGREAEVRQD